MKYVAFFLFFCSCSSTHEPLGQCEEEVRSASELLLVWKSERVIKHVEGSSVEKIENAIRGGKKKSHDEYERYREKAMNAAGMHPELLEFDEFQIYVKDKYVSNRWLVYCDIASDLSALRIYKLYSGNFTFLPDEDGNGLLFQDRGQFFFYENEDRIKLSAALREELDFPRTLCCEE